MSGIIPSGPATARRDAAAPSGRGVPVAVTLIGGAGTSALVDTGRARVLVDCGASPNLAAFDTSGLDAVVLTHAHPEHMDGLAALARRGFAGPLIATASTLRMTEIGLRDALLMRRETEGPAAAGEREAAEHGDLAGEFREEALLGEAEAVMALGRAQGFGEPYLIAPGVEATLHPAGHALGSAWVRLDIDGGGTLAVSGDLGRHGHVLLRSPAPFTDADAVLVEAAYGEGRRPATDDRDHLAHVVFTTLDKGGTVLVPAGPVDHIATVLYELARLRRVGCLPDGVSVYFDGPTGLDAVGVWRDALLAGDRELCDEVLAFGPAAFDAGVLGGVRSPEASRHLRRAEGPRVIIAGPHHGDGGRAGQHLLRLLPDERNAVILQGRAPVGSAAHALARGAEVVRIGKAMVPVHAQIAHLPGMTTHADAGEIVEWLGHGREPGTTYVVHGTPEARTALCDRIRRTLGWHTENPSGNASFTLR